MMFGNRVRSHRILKIAKSSIVWIVLLLALEYQFRKVEDFKELTKSHDMQKIEALINSALDENAPYGKEEIVIPYKRRKPERNIRFASFGSSG